MFAIAPITNTFSGNEVNTSSNAFTPLTISVSNAESIAAGGTVISPPPTSYFYCPSRE